MKKILLVVFIFLSLSQARASDTLTIRQVFNFNIGNTFDYVERVINYDYNLYPTFYTRKVISQKVVSTTQDSIIYNGNWVITNLDSIAVYQIDTFNRDTNWTTRTNFLDTNTFIFTGKVSNDISSGLFEGGISFTVTEGWGITVSGSRSIDGSGTDFNSDITTLIYFSNGSQTWGTPYYVLAGINDISETTNIHLYPNPTSDQLHLSISEMNSSSYQLILSDILGQKVYSSPIIESESTFDISGLSQGLYTWRILSNSSIIKTGKLIKQ